MKSFSWLRKLFASSTLGRRAPYRKARRPAPRSPAPLYEQLEDRVVPSTYSQNVSQAFSPGAVTQFNNQSNSTFLGASFSPSGTFGPGISNTPVGDFGALFNVNLTGRAGLNVSFTGNHGAVTPAYNATLNQGFAQPTGFDQLVSFTRQNTNVAINSGSFTTTTPSFGYGADVVADLSGSIGGQFAFFNDFGGSFNFNGGMDLPLFAVNVNDNGQFIIGGVPVFGASPGVGLPSLAQQAVGAVQNFALGEALQFGISEDPPLQLATSLAANNLQFTQDLQLQLGLPKQLGPYKVPKKAQGYTFNAGVDLGSVMEQAPTVSPSSSTPQAGGVLTASDSSTVAVLNLQAGALAGSLLGLGALGMTDSINLPLGVSASFTPVSFLLQPTLIAAQAITLQPVSQLTYWFTDPVTGAVMNPDVIRDGRDLGNVSSVTFTPGQDTVGVRFAGNKIKVTPSWEFKEVLTNEVELDADLDATLTVGQLTMNVPGLDPISTGALYQQQFQFANSKLMTLFDQTSTVLDQTVGVGANSLQSFVIGDNFQLSTDVTTTADANSTGSLRFAVLSANLAAANALAQGNSPGKTVIQLGAGTYQLTLTPTASDGSNGNLLVASPDNLTIVGAGAGQTIIQAAFSAGQTDRLLHVANGASLTLSGLTLEDGNSADSLVDPGEGGGILADAGSTLDIENCALTDNTAPGTTQSGLTLPVAGFGGAILSYGSLTISDSTIANNSAVATGGGVTVHGGPFTLQNSTFESNTVNKGYESTNSGGIVAFGGGLELEETAATIEGCSFLSNTAAGTGGGTPAWGARSTSATAAATRTSSSSTPP
jgi:hypothetical protein